LTDDRDSYLAIAENVANGHGYSATGKDAPTAFRPPLYPLVLALGRLFVEPAWIVAVLHVLCGTATVYLTVCLGRRLGMQGGALVAGGLVAVDPLLLRYSTLPMTETLFTMLVTLLLLLMPDKNGRAADVSQPVEADALSASNSTGWWQMSPFWIGGVFGLCVLCRPTLWIFGGLVGSLWFWQHSKQRLKMLHRCAPLLLGVAIVVLPWGIRNSMVFGRFLFTTTHGGYTLLLANNRVFYDDVVVEPWGTVWEEPSLRAWQSSLEETMRKEHPPVEGESERDRWMYRRATDVILDDPATFGRACWLRFRRFWNVVPLGGSDRHSVGRGLVWSVGVYYSLLLAAGALGAVKLFREKTVRWVPILFLIVSFSAVHLVFWSNARMRAPLMPAIALLAVCGATSSKMGRLGRVDPGQRFS